MEESGGTLADTLREWEDTEVFLLDAEAELFEAMVSGNTASVSNDIGFVLSDDQPLQESDLGGHAVARCSLGTRWLQGHAAVHVVHWLLDRHA